MHTCTGPHLHPFRHGNGEPAFLAGSRRRAEGAGGQPAAGCTVMMAPFISLLPPTGHNPGASQCYLASPGGQLWAAFLVTPFSRNVPASVKSGLAPVCGAARPLLMQPCAALLPIARTKWKEIWEGNKEVSPLQGPATICLGPRGGFLRRSLVTVTAWLSAVVDGADVFTPNVAHCHCLRLGQQRSWGCCISHQLDVLQIIALPCLGLVFTFSSLKSSVAPTALWDGCCQKRVSN